ncbi:MAG TPA: hypothetical protein PLS23_01895 [Phycisphaerae bacterium]|nr:hypothetical protein [Phycisphaerae bacterium]
MLKEKFDLSLLTEASPEILAWAVPGGRLFGWLCRSILIPAGWAALSNRKGQDPVLVGPGKPYEDQDTDDVLFVRSGPVRCSIDATDLRSADGHAFIGSLEICVRVVEDPAELGAFRRTFMGRSEIVRRMDLQRHLQWELHKVLSDLAAAHTADDLLRRIDSSEIRKAVDARLGGLMLAGGLTIDGPVTAHFDSPAYREFRRRQAELESRKHHVAARARIQQALAQAQKERLSHIVGLLEQLEKAAESRTDLSVADLLRTFSESERAEMYAALWHVSKPARRTRYVAAVSGQELLLFSPDDLQKPTRRIALPEHLGPLRSVSVDERSLEAQLIMVGARLGMYLVDSASGEVVDSLSAAELDAGLEIRGGVNASAMSDYRVYATHSELGLLSWTRGMFNPPVEKLLPEVTAGAETVRCARFADGRLWFAVDEEIWSQPEDGTAACKPTLYPGARERVSALTTAAGVLYAGTVYGRILAWDIDDPDSARVIRGGSGNPVESLAVLDNGAVDHLLIADRGSALQALVLEDSYTRRYESGSMPVRRAAVADDLFVAMNDNRDRVIAWNPRDPARPAATVIVPHLTGDTIQDLCVIPLA